MRLLRAGVPFAAAIALATVLLGCGDAGRDAPTSQAPAGPIDLVVLHTNDVWGETDPCG